MKSFLVLPIFFVFVVGASVRREDLDKDNGSKIIESTTSKNEKTEVADTKSKLDFHTFQMMKHDELYSSEDGDTHEDVDVSDSHEDTNSSKIVEVNQVHPSLSVNANETFSSEAVDSNEDTSSDNKELNRNHHSPETTQVKEVLPSKSLKPDDNLNEDLLNEINETGSSSVEIEPEVKVFPKENIVDEIEVVEKRAKKDQSEESVTTETSTNTGGDSKVTIPSSAIEKFRIHQSEVQHMLEENKQKIANLKLKNKDQPSSSTPAIPEDIPTEASTLTPKPSVSVFSVDSPEADSSTGQDVPRAVSASEPAKTPREKAEEIIQSVTPAKNNAVFNQTVQLPPLTPDSNGNSGSQNVQILGDKANATITRTSNSLSIEAHNIL